MSGALLEKLSNHEFYSNNGKLCLKIGNCEVAFSTVTGTVVGYNHDSQISISGGGGYIDTNMSTGRTEGHISSISSTTTEYENFFIVDESGHETKYQLVNWGYSFRDGQKVTAVHSNTSKGRALIGMVNHSTNTYRAYTDGKTAKLRMGVAREYGEFKYILSIVLGVLIVGFIIAIVVHDFFLPKSMLKTPFMKKHFWDIVFGVISLFEIGGLVYWFYEFKRLYFGNEKLKNQLVALHKALF